jgi:hypothetical protein
MRFLLIEKSWGWRKGECERAASGRISKVRITFPPVQ